MRLIDADALMITLMDKDLDHVQDNDGLELCQIIDEQPTVQAISIPENATNTEVLKALFPKDMWKLTEDDAEWGNEPYKYKGNEI